MEAKITVTDYCGAHCVTCPQHTVQPKWTMPYQRLVEVLEAVTPFASSVFINGVGDYLCLSSHQTYSDIIGEWFVRSKKLTSITTNCGFKGRPRLTCSLVICSFNAVTPETFDQCIGLAADFWDVVKNIRYLTEAHERVEVHSLVHPGNPTPKEPLLKLFGDLPVAIRVSEKYDKTVPCQVTGRRVYCDYLGKLVVDALGRVRLCNHDYFGKVVLGDVGDIKAALRAKERFQEAHRAGRFEGVCTGCTYNLAEPGHIYYIKGSPGRKRRR